MMTSGGMDVAKGKHLSAVYVTENLWDTMEICVDVL